MGFSPTVSDHIRSNVVGYVALFLVLTGGSAYALDGSNTVFSDDIVNGEVKKDDLGGNAVVTGKIADGGVGIADLAASSVTSGKVADNSLNSADLGTASVGAFELAGGAFRQEDIKAQYSGFSKAYGIPPNAIQSDEISDGAVELVDLADEAKGPAGFNKSDDDTGVICNLYCTEGSLALPPGFYAIFAKIVLRQDDIDADRLWVECQLEQGGTQLDLSREAQDDGIAPLTTLSMQSVRLLISNGSVSVNCRDGDVGDVRGSDLSITAIRLGSLTAN
jgi:hypothetical protein